MPIRIEKDPEKKSNRNTPSRPSNPGRGGMSGGGGLGGILGALLPFLFKKPKLLIIVAIGAGLWWWFSNSGGGTTDVVTDPQEIVTDPNAQSTGADLIPEEYEKASIYEPLADNKKNPMPSETSLLAYAPSRKSQGSQGSCVGWASSYAARTILHSKATGNNPNSVAFSPSYLYNNIALEGCQGTYIKKAMEYMHGKGVAPFSKFGYDERSCSKKPDRQLMELADDFKIKGYSRLTKVNSQNPRDLKTDMLAIKQNLAQGAPVVIGMMVGGSFMNQMVGQKAWYPSQQDYNNVGSYGGHAMCVIGYDDFYENNEGAFQIMNSWGEQWGDKGIFWMTYSDFDYFTKEAYGLYPMGDANAPKTSTVELSIAAVERDDTNKRYGFQKLGDIAYNTLMPKQTRFKMEVTNSNECFIYIIGQEVDLSTYVLFPYTERHSPHCGITGTRLFPNDYSLYPDDESDKDSFVIIASKIALDYDKLNQAISSSSGNSLEAKVKNALGAEMVIPNSDTNNNAINMTIDFGSKNLAAAVIQVTKN